ncbi:hypothetical protein JTB14_017123 [Gonioctena quinquepunctata]|nr:hypothetical protein JTB14_017123 [Gonioctena quinquepunctata]
MNSALSATSSSALDNARVAIQINNVPTHALIDTGSSETFISKQFAESCHFKMYPTSEMNFSFGGSKPPLTVCYLAPSRIQPPQLFEYLTGNINPIITESRKHSNDDYKFMKKELANSLKME